MSFPRYPKYKDSGVEWQGEVPEHWFVTKTKHVVQFTTGWTPPTGDSASFEGDNLWANISDLGPKCIYDTSKRISDGAINASRINVSPKGSLLFSFKLSIGQVSFAGEDLFTNEAIATFLPSPNLCLDYAYYAFPILLVQNAAENIYGAKLLNQELIRSASFALPSLSDQAQIAAFLDRETAKIDELVAEQRRLMELLKEKRQAVISHAVTQGLNPDAPMKPSGIEWLGDVPAHWSVTPVAYRYSVQLGKMLDSTKITGEHLRPYLRVFDVQWGDINTDELPQMDFDEDARSKFRLVSGDILVNEGGSYPGRSAIWLGTIEECYYQKALHRLRPNRPEQDTTRYMYYLMSWAANGGVFVAGGNETTIEHLPAEKLRRYRFAFPPMMEQLEIASLLDTETTKYNTLTAEAQRAIDLLQERRSALISAAVTGQIDVRLLSQKVGAGGTAIRSGESSTA
ncbi:MAG: restriction endonuclease subunit S [Rhodocyclaceae bacterium]